MNWKTKAFIQKTIANLPASNRLNYFLQKYISRNLPMSNAVLAQKENAARMHLEAFEHDGEIDINGVVCEFGAGYDLAVPLILYDEGFKKQVVTDLNPLLKLDLVNNVLDRRGIGVELIKGIGDLKTKTGIEYLPHIDARKTGFAANSFDYIHSTDTLEHIPQKDILPILQECYRLLKAGGIISCIIDLQDHYAYFDNGISPFNFYKYSSAEWESKYNNNLQYQNRLLAREYYTMFALAGFAPIQIQVTPASAEQIEQLKAMPLHPHFGKHAIEELSNLRCHIWAEKPD